MTTESKISPERAGRFLIYTILVVLALCAIIFYPIIFQGKIFSENDAINNHYPNFFVIDIKDEFLQVARLKLPHINFSFEAYYPSQQLIEFRSSTGQKFLYSANKPELFIL